MSDASSPPSSAGRPVIGPIGPTGAATAPPIGAATPPASSALGSRSGIGALGAFFIALIAIAVVVVGLYATRGMWAAGLAGADGAKDDARIEQALAQAAAARKQAEDLVANLPKPAPPGVDAKTAADIKALQDALKALAKEKESLAERITQLASKVETGGGQADAAGAQRLERLDGQLRALSSRLADIERKTAQLDQALEQVRNAGDRLSQLDARLDKIDKDAAARGNLDARSVESAKASGLIALSFRLREAIDSGQPYVAQLAPIKSLMGDDPAVAETLKALEPAAASGLPTLAALRADYARMARAAVALDDENTDLFGEAWRRLKQIVSVRRVGADVKGDDAEAVIARAEAALAQNRLADTVAQLGAVKGRPAQAAAPWLARAQLLLSAQQACDKLLSIGAQRLARTGDKT